METNLADLPPTTSAATRQTEPQVVAAVSSAEGNPALPTAFQTAGSRHLWLLAGGAVLGFAAFFWLRARM